MKDTIWQASDEDTKDRGPGTNLKKCQQVQAHKRELKSEGATAVAQVTIKQCVDEHSGSVKTKRGSSDPRAE